MKVRISRLVLTLLVLSLPALTAAAQPAIDIRIEEQSACRLWSGGYMLGFVLRSSLETSRSDSAPVDARPVRVSRAWITFADEPPIEFVAAGAQRADARSVPDRSAGIDSERLLTAHVPLSVDPADWPASLLPGDYELRFSIEAQMVDGSGEARRVEVETPTLAIHVPDPTAVQECPFDLAPPGLLVAR